MTPTTAMSIALGLLLGFICYFIGRTQAYTRGYTRGRFHGEQLGTLQGLTKATAALSAEIDAGRSLLHGLGYTYRDGAWRYDYESIKTAAASSPMGTQSAESNDHFKMLDAASTRLKDLCYEWVDGEWRYAIHRRRDADRERFQDEQFNKWLDESVAENGMTVWDMLVSTTDAHAGWTACKAYSYFETLTDIHGTVSGIDLTQPESVQPIQCLRCTQFYQGFDGDECPYCPVETK